MFQSYIFGILFFVISYASNGQILIADSTESVKTYLEKADSFLYDDFASCIAILDQAKLLADVNRNERDLAEVYHKFAVAHYVKGDYAKSLQYYLQGLEIFRKENDDLGIAKCLMGQGLVQQGIDRHTEAVHFFNEAITFYKKSGNYAASNPAYVNIAISQIENGKYKDARENLDLAIKLSRQAKRKGVEHLALNKLGEIEYLEGNIGPAIANYYTVLRDPDQPNNWEKSFAHSGLAQSYLYQKNLYLAEKHGLEAFNYATMSSSLWDLERNSKILYNIYLETRNIPKALEYLQVNQQYKDSLYDQKKLREINLLQLKSTEAKNLQLEASMELKEKELEINKIIVASLIILSITLLSLLLLIWKNNRQKKIFNEELKKKNQIISAQNEEISHRIHGLDISNQAKNKLFSILSHDLRSPIGSMKQLLELMKMGEFNQEERDILLDEMLLHTSETSQMIHNLLKWANSQLEGITVKKEDLNLVQEVSNAISAYKVAAGLKNINIVHNTPGEKLEIHVDQVHLSVILHNLISNATKYTSKGKKLALNYLELEEEVHLKIFNEGESISESKITEILQAKGSILSQQGTGMETGTGIGILLVKQFLDVNDANLQIKGYPGLGSEFTIIFKKAKKEELLFSGQFCLQQEV